MPPLLRPRTPCFSISKADFSSVPGPSSLSQANNTARVDGGGLSLRDGATLRLDSTIVEGNSIEGTGSRGGGVFVQNTSRVDISSSVVVRPSPSPPLPGMRARGNWG